jgi:hypothetical protein
LRFSEGVRDNWTPWNPPDADKSQLTFENLVSLRLEIVYPELMQWIEESWHFPILKNLALIGAMNRISFLQRVRMTLEKLQLHVGSNQWGTIRDVYMPKLKEISLVDAVEMVRPSGHWYTAIKAPHLCRVVISLLPTPYNWYNTPQVIGGHMNDILTHSQSVKKVVIIVPTGKWVHPSSGTRDPFILRMEGVVGWCDRGLDELEIVSGKKAERRRYTAGSSLSFEGMDALDYYTS